MRETGLAGDDGAEKEFRILEIVRQHRNLGNQLPFNSLKSSQNGLPWASATLYKTLLQLGEVISERLKVFARIQKVTLLNRQMVGRSPFCNDSFPN